MKFYNLTSAWGCYKKNLDGSPGVDPDALFITVGCKGTWQSIQNNLVYTNYANGIENFVAAEVVVDRFTTNGIQGSIEAQITVLLLDNALKFASTLMMAATVFASVF